MGQISRTLFGTALLLGSLLAVAPSALAFSWGGGGSFCDRYPSSRYCGGGGGGGGGTICNPSTGKCRAAPEINAAGAPTAALLVLGGVAVVIGRRRRRA